MNAVNKQVVFQGGLGLMLKSKGEKKEIELNECPESLLKYLPL